MSLKNCIDNAVSGGEITLEEGQSLKKRYDKLARQILAKGEVREQIAAELEAEAARRKKLARMTEEARKRLEGDIFNHTNASGNNDPMEALAWKLDHGGQARFESVTSVMHGIMGLVHGGMRKSIHEFRTKMKASGDLGRQMGDTYQLQLDMVRELFGESTNNPLAKELANEIGHWREELRQMFNARGGNIGKLEGYAMPQHYNTERVQGVTEDQFVKDFMADGVLDREKMKHAGTGKVLTEEELEASIRYAYNNITTEGWATREPTGAPMGGTALFNRHSDHRFFHFTGSEAYLNIMQKYGDVDAFRGRFDPWATVTGYVNTMARDIALMEVLGPNPVSMMRYLTASVKKYAAELEGGQYDRPDRRAEEYATLAERMYDEITGSNRAPEPGWLYENVANIMQAARNWAVASKLGGAGISAISDMGLRRQAQRMAGMSETLIPLDYIHNVRNAGQQRAMQQSLIAESALHVATRQSRHAASSSFEGLTGYMAERVLVVGGLAPMTQAVKHTTGLELQAYLGSMINKSWPDLPEAARKGMETFGLSESDWSVLQQAGTNAAGFLDPARVYGIDPKIAFKYNGYIHMIMRASTGELDTRTRVGMMGGSRAGTIYGEVLRNMWQFKGFGVGLIFNHGLGLMREIKGGNYGSAAGRVVNTFIIMTLMGAVAMQLKDMFNGRDPRDMSEEEFWLAALIQGGGLGIYGDFIFADHNRMGGTIGETVAGPVGGMIGDATRLTFGNIANISEDKDTNFGREAIRALKNNMPGGNLFYLRLALDRMVFERLQEIADPKAQQAFRRQMRRRQKDYGQEFWWRPGETQMDRLPDFSAAVETR